MTTMASEHDIHRQHKQRLKDELGDYREVLEAVADLDNELSADAECALEILDGFEDQE